MEPWIALLGSACCCLSVAVPLVGVAAWFLVRGRFAGKSGGEASSRDPSLTGPTARMASPTDLAPTTEVPRAPEPWLNEPAVDVEPTFGPTPGGLPPEPRFGAPPPPPPLARVEDVPADFDDEDDLATVVAPPPPGLLSPPPRGGAAAPSLGSPASAPPPPPRSSAIHARRPGQTIIAFEDDEDDEDNEIG